MAASARSKTAPPACVYDAGCPSRSVLDHATSRWGMLILVMLLDKTHRFSELARRIGGVSERMLAHSLRLLEEDGLVQRTVYPTKPPKVEYSLTSLGRDLAQRVQGLTDWVEANIGAVLEHRATVQPRPSSHSAAAQGGSPALDGEASALSATLSE